MWMVLAFVASFAGAVYCEESGQIEKATDLKHILYGPLNDAELVGLYVILECEGVDNTSRISWTEYASGYENGQPISDGEYILPGHPSAERYHIIHDSPNKYDLLINTTVFEDGGKYECSDVTGPSAFAQLVMLATNPNCVSSIPTNGEVIEYRYYTIECTVDYRAESPTMAPIMTWTGPEPFDVENSTTDTTVWSRVGFRATSSMTGEQFSCKTNFTEDGFDDQTDSATNAPSYEYIYYSLVITAVLPSPYAGASYIRWGRTVCEATADVVYRGWAAGSYYGHQFGGSDYLCLPETMEWGNVFDGLQDAGSRHYRVEYQVASTGTPFSFENNGGVSILNYDAPCVACITNRSTDLMIAGTRSCPAGWIVEYRGYLASEISASFRTSQVCVDEAPETIPGSSGNGNEALWSVVELECSGYTGYPCEHWWELACVICTK